MRHVGLEEARATIATVAPARHADVGLGFDHVVDLSTLTPDQIHYLVKVWPADSPICYPHHVEVGF